MTENTGYEVCRFEVPIFASQPPTEPKGKIAIDEWRKRVELYVKKADFDKAKGYLSDIQYNVLSKERKIGEKNGCYVFSLDLFEYVNFINRIREKIGNKKVSESPKQTVPSYSIEKTETWHKNKLPENLKENLKNLGSKRRNRFFVPEEYHMHGFGKT